MPFVCRRPHAHGRRVRSVVDCRRSCALISLRRSLIFARLAQVFDEHLHALLPQLLRAGASRRSFFCASNARGRSACAHRRAARTRRPAGGSARSPRSSGSDERRADRLAELADRRGSAGARGHAPSCSTVSLRRRGRRLERGRACAAVRQRLRRRARARSTARFVAHARAHRVLHRVEASCRPPTANRGARCSSRPRASNRSLVSPTCAPPNAHALTLGTYLPSCCAARPRSPSRGRA